MVSKNWLNLRPALDVVLSQRGIALHYHSALSALILPKFFGPFLQIIVCHTGDKDKKMLAIDSSK